MAGSGPTNASNPSLLDFSERTIEAILKPYSNTSSSSSRSVRLSESEVRQISTALSAIGKESWSKVPRTYAVLHMIKNVQVLDSFVSNGVSDLWFPFSHKTLPDSLRSTSARFEFLELQDFVLTKALDLEREDGKHRHFSKSDDIPLQKIEELGKGGYGFVDRVVSTITYKEYARKLIPRGKTFKKNTEVLRSFEQELSHLKKLSHLHIVELIGSYTDPRFVGIIMAPVADCNLQEFLHRGQLSPGDRSFLRTFYGCLVAALCYLHENKVRHKDIKPQNVLVKGHHVFLTDFGISLDWSDLGQSTTTGMTVRTPRYSAPEVAEYMPRNSSADVWSLACVFLEIWTVLKGKTIQEFFGYLSERGSKSTCYYLNQSSISEWCRDLQLEGISAGEDPPLKWIRGALQTDQIERWTAQMLADSISEANDDPEQRYAFSGTCCIDLDESTASGVSSKRSSRAIDETGASSIEVYQPSSILSEKSMHSNVSKAAQSLSQTLKPPTRTPSKLKEVNTGQQARDHKSAYAANSSSYEGGRETASSLGLTKPYSTLGHEFEDNDVAKLAPMQQSHQMREPATSLDPPAEDGSRLQSSTEINVSDPHLGPILDELQKMGITEEQIAQNEGFIKSYIRAKREEESLSLAPHHEELISTIPPAKSEHDLVQKVLRKPVGSFQGNSSATGPLDDVDSCEMTTVPEPFANVMDQTQEQQNLVPWVWKHFPYEELSDAPQLERANEDNNLSHKHPGSRQSQQSGLEDLGRGDGIIPPCERCWLLQTDCIRHSTACIECMKRNEECSWRHILTRDFEKATIKPQQEQENEGNASSPKSQNQDTVAELNTSAPKTDQPEAQQSGQLSSGKPQAQLNEAPSQQLQLYSTDKSLVAGKSVDLEPQQEQNKIARICTKCNKPITGQFVRALAGTFHVECFTCADCSKIVASKFYPVEDESGAGQLPLCERDYFSRLDLICYACGGALRGSYITALDRKYHLEHFTCNMCSFVFGAQDSYYERNGNVYCRYHYYTGIAEKCQGCQTAVVGQYVEMPRNGRNELWHPECYMIYKFWNVRLEAIKSSTSDPVTTAEVKENPSEADRIAVYDHEAAINDKIYLIWSTLSTYEERFASNLSDALTASSDASKGETASLIFHSLALMVVFIECLFNGLDNINKKNPQTKELPGRRETKLLCTKYVAMLTLLSKAIESKAKLGVTQELLATVTSISHYLKLTIRIGLQQSLRVDQSSPSLDCLTGFLHIVDEWQSDAFQPYYPEQGQMLALANSDCCTLCGLPVEDWCFKQEPRKWHVSLWHPTCLKCDYCGESDFSSNAKDSKPDYIGCLRCGRLLIGKYQIVSYLGQYVYLLKIGLARSWEHLRVNGHVSTNDRSKDYFPTDHSYGTTIENTLIRPSTRSGGDSVLPKVTNANLNSDGKMVKNSAALTTATGNQLYLDDIPRFGAAWERKRREDHQKSQSHQIQEGDIEGVNHTTQRLESLWESDRSPGIRKNFSRFARRLGF